MECHIPIKTILKFLKSDLVRELSRININKDKVCELFIKRTKSKVAFIQKNITKRSLELLHIDYFGLEDDFSWFTCFIFIKHKDEYFEAFQIFCKRVQSL